MKCALQTLSPPDRRCRLPEGAAAKRIDLGARHRGLQPLDPQPQALGRLDLSPQTAVAAGCPRAPPPSAWTSSATSWTTSCCW